MRAVPRRRVPGPDRARIAGEPGTIRSADPRGPRLGARVSGSAGRRPRSAGQRARRASGSPTASRPAPRPRRRPSSRRARPAASAPPRPRSPPPRAGRPRCPRRRAAPAGRGSPRRTAAPARRRWRRAQTGTHRRAAVTASPPTPPIRNSPSTTSGPWRRSSSQPNRPIAADDQERVAGVVVGERRREQPPPVRARLAEDLELVVGRPARSATAACPTSPRTTSTIVAYGRRVGPDAGISSRRSRVSSGGGRAPRRFSATRPSRSSFGARLRSRLPQYGHSVM